MALSRAEIQARYRARKKSVTVTSEHASIDRVLPCVTVLSDAEWAQLDKLERTLRSKGKSSYADILVSLRNHVSSSKDV